MNPIIRYASTTLLAGAIVGVSGLAAASSHREAPAIAEDQFADNTDVYAFISPGDSDRIVFVANYVPLLIPSSGPNFYKFADSVRYDIRVDNDGDAVADLIYEFQFETAIANPDTFLYNVGAVNSLTDADLNVTQTYTLWRRDVAAGTRTAVVTDAPVAPWNVGSRTFPGTDYDTVADSAATTSGTTTVFAGPRDEPFFVDLHVFDLLGVGGAPTTDGVNVMSLVLEVPITEVAAGGTRPAAGTAGLTSQVGVYATAMRRRVRILPRRGDAFVDRRGPTAGIARHFGRWSQVSRLGWPLVNEAVIPLRDKNKYLVTSPANDVDNFGTYILNPELNGLLSAVLGLSCASIPAGGRTDIVGLLGPNGTTVGDMLRIDIEAGQTGADTAFPNGRTLDDDVTDTLLTVICDSGSAVGDGVDANDLAFSSTFPYLASPHSGNP